MLTDLLIAPEIDPSLQAAEIASLSELASFLDDAAKVPPDSRVLLLIAGSRRLVALPLADRLKGFLLAIAAAWALDVEHRAAVLHCLVRRLWCLPASGQFDAFIEMRDATMALPPGRVPDAFENLIVTLPALAESWRLHAMQSLLSDLKHVRCESRPRLLWCMAREVSTLLPEQRNRGFQHLLHSVRRLAQDQRSVPLVALSWVVADLSAEDRGIAVQEVLRDVGTIAVDDRRAPISELAAVLPKVPQAQREVLFNATFKATAALPIASRGEPLRSLAGCLCGLQHPAPVFDALHAEALQLPASSRGDCLEGLALQVGGLEMSRRRARFDAILQALPSLPDAYQTLPLQALIERALPTLPDDAQESAFDDLLQAIQRLNPSQRPRAALDLPLV
jgi:hypothetical protein